MVLPTATILYNHNHFETFGCPANGHYIYNVALGPSEHLFGDFRSKNLQEIMQPVVVSRVTQSLYCIAKHNCI